MEEKSARPHRVKTAGVKAQKKRDKGKTEADKKKHNPKAFTFSGGHKSVQSRVQRNLDIHAKKERVPKTDKTPSIPPPYTIVVQGPPGVGKTTLIRSLVRHWTKHNVSTVAGTVTAVSSRTRRFTIVECDCKNLPQMLDLAKVADLVLLMINANYGFEMETFEFIDIMKAHGFPNVIGVLTHLDEFEGAKQMRGARRNLKTRFWTEVYEGSKLFYLSGLQYGRYNKVEVANLSRFLAIQKFHPLSWRVQHPYLLALRWEEDGNDINGYDQDKEGTATMNFYGYIQGARMRQGQEIHVPGAGDFVVKSITAFLDPCPPPILSQKTSNVTGSRLLRTLKDKHRSVYAPGCDIGNVRFDESSMYIHLRSHKTPFTPSKLILKDGEVHLKETQGTDSTASSDDEEMPTKSKHVEEKPWRDAGDHQSADEANSSMETQSREMPEAVSLVRNLQQARGAIRDILNNRQLLLVKSSKSVLESTDNTCKDDVKTYDVDTEELFSSSNVPRLTEKESTDLFSPPSQRSFSQIVYESAPVYEEILPTKSSPTGHEKLTTQHPEGLDWGDAVRIPVNVSNKWKLDFGGHDPDSTVQQQQLFEDDDLLGDPDHKKISLSPLLYGDARRYGALDSSPESSRLHDAWLYSAMGVKADSLTAIDEIWTEESLQRLRSAKFYSTIKIEATDPSSDDVPESSDVKEEESKDGGPVSNATSNKQKEEKRQETLKTQMEIDSFTAGSADVGGAGIGVFVRVVVERLPSKWKEQLSNNSVIVLGGLLPAENQRAMIQIRMKKHRWAPKILKNKDPLFFSIGWRRFQCLPIFSIADRNDARMRMLKYTPEHMHCIATFFAPIVPPSTGVVAIRNMSSRLANFRISATGIVLESSDSFEIVKKLKLIGEPKRIFKNTAFVNGMFNTDLEAAKFISANIQTTSGIRGRVKKADGVNGDFRATFEDKIKLSDLVVCKTWIRVDPPKFYNPISDVDTWRHLRTIGEVRADNGISLGTQKDSLYSKKPVRPEDHDTIHNIDPDAPLTPDKLKIPKSLLRDLPYAVKPKILAPESKIVSEEAKLPMDSYEKKVSRLFEKLESIREYKQTRKMTVNKQKLDKKRAAQETIESARYEKHKRIRKDKHVRKGQIELKRRKKMKLDGGIG